MKKLFLILFICLPFIFTGCATKQGKEKPEVTAENLIENIEENEDQPDEELSEETETQEEITETPESFEDEQDLEEELPSENELTIEDIIGSEELGEIEEPVVRDAPFLEEEPEVAENEEPAEEPEVVVIEVLEDITLEIVPDTSEEETVLEDNSYIEDDVLDVDDEDSLVTENTEEPSEEETEEDLSNTEEAEIIPSRSVKIRIGEYLDVDYPGKGWIYLGITDLSKKVTYFGRKLGTENTKYTFLGKESGTVILHFYKEDVLSGTYIDDYLEVEIDSNRTTSKEHVTAPSYSEVVPKPATTKEEAEAKKAQNQSEEKTSESKTEEKSAPVEEKSVSESKPASETEKKTEVTKTVTAPVKNKEPEPSVEKAPVLTSDELLEAAKKDFNSKNYKNALEYAKAFLLTAPTNADEGYFLLGQIYESNSDVRDIKKSVEAYDQLTSSYPASNYWEDANKRSVYLKRFYINVR